jgi:hypothetical protein
MKKSKSSQSKKKQLPKLKKYEYGTVVQDGDPVSVDTSKQDRRRMQTHSYIQNVVSPSGVPSLYKGSVSLTPEQWAKTEGNYQNPNFDIRSLPHTMPADSSDYKSMMYQKLPNYQRRNGGVYKNGGKIAKDIAAGLYGVGEGVLDTVTLGATDKLTDMGYKALQKAGGSSEDEIREQDSIHGYGQAAGAVGGGFINPAATGNAIAQAGEGLGEGVSRGNESKENAQTAGMLLNTAGKIGGMAYGMAGSPMTAGMESQSSNFNNSNFGGKLNKYNEIAGQAGAFMQNGGMYRHGGMKHPHMPHFSSSPPAPSGMYGTQLAYGGEQPNAEVEGGPNSQEAITPSDGRMPQVFGGGGLEQVSENPYGKPTYMTTRDSNTHEQADSNGQTGVPVNLSPGTAISSNKTKNPMTNRPFLKDLLKITNKEKKHSDILTNKDSTPSDINTARVVLPMLAKAKENFEKYMAAVVQNKEQAKQLKKGIIPSTDNEQAEPRGMSEQSEGEMATARYGGMYANGGKLPQSLLKARLESHMSPEEANDYIANYKSGGIHIKPENRGKFTAYKERTGKTTEEALHSPNAHVRQMANFARNAAKWKHEMGGMQKFYGGGGYSDATGSYDGLGNMISGPMGEILNDDQYRNAVNYGDAWNSSKAWGTKTQEQADYMNDVVNSYDKNVKNKTAANANVAAQPVVTSATTAAQPSAFDPKKGQWINGKWVLFDVPSTLAHSTPEGTFNAAGEQTSSTYGRPMMQTFDPIQPALTDKDQAEKDLQNSYKNVPSSIGELKSPRDYSNYADYARQAAVFAGQNLGNIRDFVKTKGGKEFDKENYGQMTPQMPDYSEAKRAALNEAAAYRKMLLSSGLTGGNAPATLGMMSQMQGMSQEQAAKIMEAEQQAKTGVYNQFLPLNKQLQMQERADTQANKARSEDIARMAVKGLSENIGGAGSDYGMSKNDKETLAIISNSYPDYAYNQKKKGWYHKTSGEKLDPSKVKPKTS